MDPDPETRPCIDEILLHPQLSMIMNQEQKLKMGTYGTVSQGST